MATEQPPTRPTAAPRKLSTPWYVALVGGVCVVMAVIGAVAKNYGRELGGDTGVVTGLAIGFVVVCLICAALTRLVGNQTMPIVGGLFVGMAAAGVAEAAGLNDAETWRSVARYAIFFGVYFIWVTAAVPAIARRPTAPSSSERPPS